MFEAIGEMQCNPRDYSSQSGRTLQTNNSDGNKFYQMPLDPEIVTGTR